MHQYQSTSGLTEEAARIDKWLSDAVVVAHELAGAKLMCGGSTICLPKDICISLYKKGILFRQANGEYTFGFYHDYGTGCESQSVQVFVKTTKVKTDCKMSVIIHR